MPSPTFNIIETIVVSGTPTTITFSSIPQLATDLIMIGSVRGNGTADEYDTMYPWINGNYASSNYYLSGDSSGGTQAGSSASQSRINNAFGGETVMSPIYWYVPNYSTSRIKSSTMRTCAIPVNYSLSIKMTSLVHATTAAVTSISFYNPNAFATGSTLSLYSITKA